MATVLVWFPVESQVPQAEYVNEVQVVVDPPGPAGMFSGWKVPEERLLRGPVKITASVSLFVTVTVPELTTIRTSRNIALSPR